MIGGICCPACRKVFNSRKAVLLHFRRALEGWDPLWNRTMPHSRWARQRGLKVEEGDYFFDGQALKEVLYSYLDSLT